MKSDSLKLTESGKDLINTLYNFNKKLKTKKMINTKEQPVQETIYLSNGKSLFDGNIVSFSICLSDLEEKIKDHKFIYENKEYVKLEMHKKREADQYGNTHFVKVNTFKIVEKENKKEEKNLPF